MPKVSFFLIIFFLQTYFDNNNILLSGITSDDANSNRYGHIMSATLEEQLEQLEVLLLKYNVIIIKI